MEISHPATTSSHKNMKVVYAQQTIPLTIIKSIFIAGPSPRGKRELSFRPQCVEILKKLNFDGHLFIPEAEGGGFPEGQQTENGRTQQIKWEDEALNMAVCVFYLDYLREMKEMPALTTNDEWGFWKNSGKVLIGAPLNAQRVAYQEFYAKKLGLKWFESLEEILAAAVAAVGHGSKRNDGERYVPLMIWNTPSFQSWYSSQQFNQNQLLKAKVLWAFFVGGPPPPNTAHSTTTPTITTATPTKQGGPGPGPGFLNEKIFFWSLKVSVFISKENRVKDNEVVISRPDSSHVLVYCKGKDLMSCKVVLVKEFRSASRTSSSFIYELPGGSSFSPSSPTTTTTTTTTTNTWFLEQATEELQEETGYELSSAQQQRMIVHGARQLMSTAMSTKGHLFSVEFSAEEFEWFEKHEGEQHGIISDSERTTLIIASVHSLLFPPHLTSPSTTTTTTTTTTTEDKIEVDWSQLGMILSVLSTLSFS